MILQTDVLLNKDSAFTFDESGCALFDLTEWAVKKGYYTFSREVFYNDCLQWKKMGIIDYECTVLSWDLLAKELNLPYRIVIEEVDGQITHKLQRQPREDEIQLLRLFNPYSGYKHFVNADNRDNVTYDPLGESKTAEAYYERKGTIVSRRILRRID